MKRIKLLSVMLIAVLCTQISIPLSFADDFYNRDNQSDGATSIIIDDNAEEACLTEEEISLFQQEFKMNLLEESKVQSIDNPVQIDNRRRGPKSKLAKIAAKKMLKKLTHMGKQPYTKALKKAVSILPKKARRSVMRTLSYEKVKGALNFAANLEGTITDAVEKGLKHMGIKNDTVAKYGAKVIVFILF